MSGLRSDGQPKSTDHGGGPVQAPSGPPRDVVINRLMMAALGGGAGLALYALFELEAASVIGERGLMMTFSLWASFFIGLLAMIGPLRLAKAALGAGAIALLVMALLGLASLGFNDLGQMLDSPNYAIAAIVLATVPLPFWIAANGPGWRDYPTLFTQSWSIVVRYAIGWCFAGLVWVLVLLSDALLDLVGITLIADLIELEAVPFLLTGLALGFGLAVVQEFPDYVSPYLLLRLLRLLLPVVLIVSSVFLLALPLRGISGLLGQLSFAFTLLAMAGAAASLVTSSVDQTDSEAAHHPALALMTRAMALILPLLSGLGAWAIWQRVAQYGWTPDRVFAAEVALIGLGYGLLYALAILSGAAWRAGIRRANIWMALAIVALAVLSLTPLLSPQRISAQSTLARFEDGRLPVTALQPDLLRRWGKPGEAALAALEAKAAEPGQEALAAQLKSPTAINEQPALDAMRESRLAEVKSLLPLQPEYATATRDIYLDVMDDWTLGKVLQACRRSLPRGGPACVMVVGDLLPQAPGEEAIVALYGVSGYLDLLGYDMNGLTGAQASNVQTRGYMPIEADAEALIKSWQMTPPAAVALPLNQFNLPSGGVFLQP